jgi:hypothetical protein
VLHLKPTCRLSYQQVHGTTASERPLLGHFEPFPGFKGVPHDARQHM